LKRLNSVKEIKGFPRQKFGWALLNDARIWLDLGLAWEKLGFPSSLRRRFQSSLIPDSRDGCSPRRLNPAIGLSVLISDFWYKERDFSPSARAR
jgi:hypothetical protein